MVKHIDPGINADPEDTNECPPGLRFLKKTDCRVRNLKLQHQVYCSPELELKKTERIYIMSTGEEHRKQLEVVNFVYECANFG